MRRTWNSASRSRCARPAPVPARRHGLAAPALLSVPASPSPTARAVPPSQDRGQERLRKDGARRRHAPSPRRTRPPLRPGPTCSTPARLFFDAADDHRVPQDGVHGRSAAQLPQRPGVHPRPKDPRHPGGARRGPSTSAKCPAVPRAPKRDVTVCAADPPAAPCVPAQVKAQIKLKFVAQSAQPVVCTRSFSLTQKATKMEYKVRTAPRPCSPAPLEQALPMRVLRVPAAHPPRPRAPPRTRRARRRSKRRCRRWTPREPSSRSRTSAPTSTGWCPS